MRYTGNHSGQTVRGLEPNARPPAELIPAPLLKLLVERDKLRDQKAAASQEVRRLEDPQAAAAAEAADAAVRQKAARAGKTIPEDASTAKLAADLEAAQRLHAALVTAHATVTDECQTLASELYWAGVEGLEAEREKARAEIEEAAHELADKVDRAVAGFASREWLHTGHYDTTANTWAFDVVDLSRYGLRRETTYTLPARDAIVAAAVACLTE